MYASFARLTDTFTNYKIIINENGKNNKIREKKKHKCKEVFDGNEPYTAHIHTYAPKLYSFLTIDLQNLSLNY